MTIDGGNYQLKSVRTIIFQENLTNWFLIPTFTGSNLITRILWLCCRPSVLLGSVEIPPRWFFAVSSGAALKSNDFV